METANTGAAAPRPLYAIAREIRADWKPVYFGAVPYLDALAQMGDMRSMYGADDARSIVLYFLSNAAPWRGPVARRVKAELKSMLSPPKVDKRVAMLRALEDAGQLQIIPVRS